MEPKMTVVFNTDGTVTVTMEAGDLNSVRYGLNAGVEKLESTARFLKSSKSEEAESARESAKRAKEASDALEEAVQKAIEG